MTGAAFEAGITEDRLLGGRVVIHQPQSGYRVAIDAVLLAAAVAAGSRHRALDLGAGVGAAGLCLASRIAGLRATLIEIQPPLAELAARNVVANGMGGRVRALCGDCFSPPPALAGERFDRVLVNPPYLSTHDGTAPRSSSEATATRESRADLAQWIAAAHRFLVPQGIVTLIHRADRLPAAMAALAERFGDIALYPLWAGAGKPARRVILRARSGGKGPCVVHPGLMLHRPDGDFTDEAEAVLRGGAALEF